MNKRQNELKKKFETHTAAIGTAKVLQLCLCTAVGGIPLVPGELPAALVAMAVAHQPPHRVGPPPTITGCISAGTCMKLGKLSL